MKQAKQFAARRRTLSIFFANTSSAECTSRTWIDNTPHLWTELKQVLHACDPRTIAINVDSEIAFAGGLHAGEFQKITTELGPPWIDRFVTNPLVAVEYIATMPKSRREWYQKLMETAWAVISEGFSERVIVPGQTTTDDVEWWFRERLQSLNYTTWFHPDVTILPNWFTGKAIPPAEEGRSSPRSIIQYGDLLHVDFGLTALGLNTDTQHLAYVLPPGASEHDIPQGFRDGLQKGNRLQDLVTAAMKLELTGNEILRDALASMREENITGRVYCHAIGDWGHSAGTVIGMTNLQDSVPVLGDLSLLKDSYYSIELLVEHWVPERNETFEFPLEEDVFWDEESEGWKWVYRRQEKFHLIRSHPESALTVQVRFI